MMLHRELLYGLLMFSACSHALADVPSQDNLVRNATFALIDDEGMPTHWSTWSPQWTPSSCTASITDDGLRMEASNPYAVGGVSQTIRGIMPGQAYAIEVRCRLEHIPTPYRSVLVRFGWLRDEQRLHPAAWLIRGPSLQGETAVFEDILIAPEDANGAELSLDLKWPQGGNVLWKSVSVRPTAQPESRKAKVGTVFLRPRNSTSERNIELFCEQVDRAGELGLDIVCLGETITVVGTGCNYKECAEPIPGPSTERLGQSARDNRIWVVAGLMEQDGETLYNTAVLLNRDGNLAGKYRKIHLPREEWRQGITPGHDYPVFETDFGTIAIQICYDWFFPEPEAIFAMRGAEILFAPTWGNTLPDVDGRVEGETTFRVRARDNGIYLVPSVYDGNSLVIDPMGRILASNDGQEGVFWAEIDLGVRERLPWVGYWRSIGPRDRMPESYQPLLGELDQPNY